MRTMFYDDMTYVGHSQLILSTFVSEHVTLYDIQTFHNFAEHFLWKISHMGNLG